MGQRTPLYDAHVSMGAKIVDFAGWDMPLHYGSQLNEHKQVRQDAGMFDVSHMVVSDLIGPQAKDLLRYLLANDVAKLKTPGRAIYSCMLNTGGGVIDDLIVYYFDDENYRLVTNAATREKDIDWIHKQAENFKATLTEQPDLCIIAIQGPNARDKALRCLPEAAKTAKDLKPFHSIRFDDYLIAATGYTGEDGFEVILPGGKATTLWGELFKQNVSPAGLGSRDTLRLEAGMNLYGQDMDEETSPLESGLAWTVAWQPQERNFVGREALETQKQHGVARQLFGIILEDKGVLRPGQRIQNNGRDLGILTSGSFSPTLGKGIGFASVSADARLGQTCGVEVRPGKFAVAQLVKMPFVRNGKACWQAI